MGYGGCKLREVVECTWTWVGKVRREHYWEKVIGSQGTGKAKGGGGEWSVS